METLTPADIRVYIAHKKEREDIFFRLRIADEEEKPQWQQRLTEMDRTLLQEECRFSRAKLKFVLPHEQRWETVTRELASLPDSEWKEVLRSRSGPLYQYIREYRTLLHLHARHADSIAKVNLFFRKLGYDHSLPLLGALRLGRVEHAIDLHHFTLSQQKWVHRLFQRLEIPVTLDSTMLKENGSLLALETPLVFEGRELWLGKTEAARAVDLLEELKIVSQRMQYYNAERQVRSFSHAEETAYETLQSEYLTLLREKDALFQPFYEEEKLFV